jgi:hypothetical protein
VNLPTDEGGLILKLHHQLPPPTHAKKAATQISKALFD